MKKDTDPPMRDHYDFTGPNVVRGKYYERCRAGTNIVVLEPDIAKEFPDSKAVNDALRSLLEAKAAGAGNT